MKVIGTYIRDGQLIELIEKRFLFFRWTVERIVRA